MREESTGRGEEGGGHLLETIVKMTSAKNAIEIGSSTGYSALCIANGLPEDGKMISLSINHDMANTGRKYWENSGVAEKIDPVVGPID